VMFICFGCGAYVLFGSLIECWCVVRHVSQLRFNQLFSNNKVSIKKPFTILLSPWIYPLFLYPCYHSPGVSLSHQHLHFRWPTQGTATTLATGTTTKRTTGMSARCHPLLLVLSTCWLCKHKCFRLCSRPWLTYRLLNLRHRHHR
jgi:hypothetical protein